jgi:hypothetical protein
VRADRRGGSQAETRSPGATSVEEGKGGRRKPVAAERRVNESAREEPTLVSTGSQCDFLSNPRRGLAAEEQPLQTHAPRRPSRRTAPRPDYAEIENLAPSLGWHGTQGQSRQLERDRGSPRCLPLAPTASTEACPRTWRFSPSQPPERAGARFYPRQQAADRARPRAASWLELPWRKLPSPSDCGT